MNSILESLRGKKTYLAAGMGLLYILGCAAGLWQWDEKVIAALGLGSLAFLRAGVEKTILPLAALTAILVVGPGCRTVPPERRTAEMAMVAELAAYTGASYDLTEHPNRRVFYEASLAALETLLKDGNYDPSAFAAALQALPVKQLSSDKGTILVGAAVILWDRYASEITNLDRATYVKPVMAAVRNGLRRALGN